ncbi:aldehyde dehydrogenase [Shouchella rhizosphaerae]|uniref:aldehyde dehydrogenase n=1 Tax=Shouchella rhizosphaerae TaxID=866786 RepID=UPI003F80D9AA
MTTLKRYMHYINGELTEPQSGKYFHSINPATEEPWCEVAEGNALDVELAVKAAHHAFYNSSWKDMTRSQRGHLLRQLAEKVEKNIELLSKVESTDNGKLLKEMKGQLSYLPQFLYYFAGYGDKVGGETLPIDKQDMFVFTNREPIGVVAAITPWNSPLYLTLLKLAPALVVGNTIVIKPSEYTSASIIEFVKLTEEVGFPPGVINVVTGFGKDVGDALTSHPLVRKVAFTGGAESAKKVICNSSNNFSRVSLELGGKSPNIVFEDANIENAVMGVIAGIFGASGQSCVAGSRAIVHKDIYNRFLELLLERVARIKIGDPLSLDTEMGPIATKSQLERIQSFVEKGIKEGGKLLCGGKKPDYLARGYFYEPTIFEFRDHASEITTEEIFGPVLCIMPFSSEEEAIELANHTNYALAAGIWVGDIGRAHRVSKEIEAGIVWINTYRSISPLAPIGGFKNSGYGREGGIESILEYTQIKTVWVNTSTEPMPDPFIMR